MSTATGSIGRKFDLNIDKVLESWDVCHAIRELIANALDEQVLTNTADIQVFESSPNEWIIRDFGRGLSYEHLIQTENPEKMASSTTIGKFGVGLKDALATLWRHDIKTSISSRHGLITLARSTKHTFEDLETLHACVVPPLDRDFVGTEIRLSGCPSSFVSQAKELFLVFGKVTTLETTQYGQVLSNPSGQATIYLNGLKIASENNFLFSYNITLPNAAIRKALNRERMNVGRAAYSDRVKSALLNCRGAEITVALSEDLQRLSTGDNHDELTWLEVQAHACSLLASLQNVVFVTADERTKNPDLIEHAVSDGLQTITIPERLKEKVGAVSDDKEQPVRLLSNYAKAFHESFKYNFVAEELLSEQEKQVFYLAFSIFDIIGGKPAAIKHVRISETMRPCEHAGFDADGVWLADSAQIVLKRIVLSNRERFLGTLLHEIGHALSGASDVSLRFEDKLTDLLGKVANVATSAATPSVQIDPVETKPLSSPSRQQQAEAFYSRANAYEKLGSHHSAIDDFTKAIELDPNYLQAYWGRGVSRRAIGDKAGYLADYSKAIDLDPTNAKAYFMRGLTYYGLGKEREAIADYDRAIEIEPGYLDAYCERGRCYRTGERALADFDYVLGKEPVDYDSAEQLVPDAGSYFSGGMRRYFGEAHFGRGLAFHLSRNQQQAIADFNRAIELNPDSTQAFNYRGLARYFAGDPTGSLDDLTRAIELAPDQCGKARFFVIDLHPTRDCDNAYFNRASILYSLGDRKNFLNDLSKIELSNFSVPHKPVLFFLAGITHGFMADPKDPQLALPWLDKAIDLDGNFSYAYYMRALARFELKDTEGAVADCKKACRIHATDDPCSHYVDFLSDGEATFSRGSERFFTETIARAYNLRGCIVSYFIRELCESDEGHQIDDFSQAISMQPNYAEPYYNRGNIYFEDLDEDRKAESDFTKAIELGLSSLSAYRARAIARYLIGDDHGVIEDINQTIASGAGNAEGLCLRGLAYFRLGKIDWAESDFLTAAQSHVRDLNLQGQAATKRIENLVHHAHAYAYWQRGYASYKAGDYRAAKLDYNEYAKFGYDSTYYDTSEKWAGEVPWIYL